MRQYLVDIAEYGPLSGADELRLLEAIARGTTAEAELWVLGPDSLSSVREELRAEVAKGQEAERTLIRSNLRLVVDIARDYEPTGRSLLTFGPGRQPWPAASHRDVRPARGPQLSRPPLQGGSGSDHVELRLRAERHDFATW
jgi:hypothetical protein